MNVKTKISDPHQRIMQKGLKKLDKKVPGAVITVSDRCFEQEKPDLSGPLAQKILATHQIECDRQIVPDGIEAVQSAIRAAIVQGARVVFTTGGTGVTPRDLTPEATAPLLALRLEAIAQQIINHGLSHTPLASLSRGLVGITERGEKGVLIINAPGSQGGVKDTLTVVGPLIPHILEQFDPVTFALQ